MISIGSFITAINGRVFGASTFEEIALTALAASIILCRLETWAFASAGALEKFARTLLANRICSVNFGTIK